MSSDAISHKHVTALYGKLGHASARNASNPTRADLHDALVQKTRVEFKKSNGYDFDGNPPDLAPGSKVSRIENTITEETDKANPNNSATHRHGGGHTHTENEQAVDAARDDIRQYIIDLQSKTNEHSPEWQYKDFKKALPGGFAVVGTVTLARAADNSAHATVAHVEALVYKKA